MGTAAPQHQPDKSEFVGAVAPLPPSDEGKRSAVAVVNDSPVDCQSRDRAARRRLSAKLTEGWEV